MPKIVKHVELEEVEHICFMLVDEFFPNSEPVPLFETRYKGVLESCLTQPFMRIDRKDLYPTLFNKASSLFYFCVKNHPFENGNKRIAILVLLLFAYKNNFWLESPKSTLYDLALSVAKSETKDMNKTLEYINFFIEKYAQDESKD